jgi:plastocyanin
MEGTFMLNKHRILSLICLAGFLGMNAVHAGTVLVSPNNQADPEENDYPSSSFGTPPAHGISSGFASRQTQDMDQDNNSDGTESNRTGRGIASVGQNPNSGPDLGNAQHITTSQSSESRTASEMGRKGVQEVAIIASDLGYFPKTVFVSRDVPVRLFVTGSSKNTLCIMMDSFQVRKQIRSQKIEEITFTPSAPGKYRFYCPVNGMEGSLVVKELTTDSKNDRSTASWGTPGAIERVNGDTPKPANALENTSSSYSAPHVLTQE